jgi:hypothetical protein
MVFSKPTISLATLLLAASVVAGRDNYASEPRPTFVPAPPMDADMSAWAATRTAYTGKHRITKPSKVHAARRTVYADDLPSESSISLIQPAEVVVPTDVAAPEPTDADYDASTPADEEEVEDMDSEEADETVDQSTDGDDQEINTEEDSDAADQPADEDDAAEYKRDISRLASASAAPSPEQVAQGEKSWWQTAKSAFGLAARGDKKDANRKVIKGGKPNGKSQAKEGASPFQDASGDPGDGSWGKRDRGMGNGGPQGNHEGGKGPARGNKGDGKGHGKGPGNGAKGPGGRGKGAHGGHADGNGAPQGGHAPMKRSARFQASYNSTASDDGARRPGPPAGAFSGVAMPTGRPTARPSAGFKMPKPSGAPHAEGHGNGPHGKGNGVQSKAAAHEQSGRHGSKANATATASVAADTIAVPTATPAAV